MLASMRYLQAGRLGLLDRRCETLGMARRPQQQRPRKAREHLAMRSEHGLFFLGMGAGGDPHRSLAPGRALLAHSRHQFFRQGDVVFQVAQHATALLLQAELAITRQIRRCLRQHVAHRAQGDAQHAPDRRVTGQRTLGQPRIDDQQRNAATADFDEQAGPDFRLHDDGDARAELVEEMPHGAGRVVGQIDMADAVFPDGARTLRTGRRRRRHQHRQLRITPAQAIEQGRGGIDLAHRHRMQPQAFGQPGLAVHGETLVPAAPVGALAAPAPEQVHERQRYQQAHRQRVRHQQQALGEIEFHRASIAEPRTDPPMRRAAAGPTIAA